MRLSAVVLTKNEEKGIRECLGALSFCDEIIVIDDLSTDKTVEMAKKLRAKVWTRALNDDFSAQRNYGLEKAQREWVLFVDIDEKITPSLRDEIQLKIQKSSPKTNGYKIRRSDFIWGRELKHGETGRLKLMRLARKEAGKWKGKVHEKWKIKGKIGELKNPLLHYPHQTISEFLKEINFYTDLKAKELYQKRVKVNWWSIVIYPLGKFLFNYFLKLGFLDGLPGFVFTLIMSFHSFLVRGKLWLLWQKNN